MSKQEEAALTLKVYELSREDALRKAREWYFRDFHPHSIANFNDGMFSEHSGQLRTLVSFWDMAAALVNDGAISLELFNNTHTEHIVVFAKIEPLLKEIREAFAPEFAVNLEKLVDATPGGRRRTARARERLKTLR